MKNKILSAVLFFLILLFVASFFKSIKKSGFKTISASLINPQFTEQINFININLNVSQLQLYKKNGIWFCSSGEYELPCQASKIKNFLYLLTKKQDLTLIKYNPHDKKLFGFDTINEVSVTYNINDSNFQTVYFGNKDFSGTARYIMNEKDEIFETETKLDMYLLPELNNWCDQNLVSQNIFGKISLNDIQNLSESNKTIFQNLLYLNHGGCIKFNSNEKNPKKKIELKTSDATSVTLLFYELNETSKAVNLIYEKNENVIADYFVKISNRTFEKIFE